MGRCFLACVVVYWFAHLLLGCQQIILAWVGNRLVLCLEGSGLFLYPLGLVGCSSCGVRSRSCIVGFLPN